MSIKPGGRSFNIANGVREFAVASPNTTAIIDGQRRFTFAELDERSNRVGQMLLASGLEPGEHVAFLSGNRAEYPEVAAGIAKAGMVMIPLNPRSAEPELDFVLKHSDAAALVLDAELADKASRPAAELSRIWTFDGTPYGVDYESALASADSTDPDISVDELDPFSIVYTSGTTGNPKGVLISHRSRSLTFYSTALDWSLGPGRRTIAVAPMFHGAGFAFAYGGIATGGTCSMLRNWDAVELLQMIERDRPHSIFLVPAHAVFLRQLEPDHLASFDVSSLETVYFNAAPLPQPLKEWMHVAWPHVGLHELYGSTEAGVVSNLRPDRIMDKERCVGPPWFMTEVKLLDNDRAPVAQGEVGELYARSPYLMNGYYKNDEATEAATTEDGYFSAGDLAWMDDDNCLYIVDRKKDMIISGGSNIYPSEVEEVLQRHSDVSEVAVIGLEDDTWGERVAAVVVTHAGSNLDVVALEDLCRKHLAGYKIPRQWEIVEAMPRNASGKILKRDLRGQFEG